MKLGDAVASVMSLLVDDDIVVTAGGAIAATVFRVGDRPRNLYTRGLSGQVLTIALGLALTRLERVVAIDVVSGLRRDLGTLALVGSRRPRNLYHLVVDGQQVAPEPTPFDPPPVPDLSALAASSGYVWSRTCFAGVYGPMALEQWCQAPGPAFLDVLTDPDGDDGMAAGGPLAFEANLARFRAALAL